MVAAAGLVVELDGECPVGFKLLDNRWPRAMVPVGTQAVLGGMQQMVGKERDKYVGVAAVFALVVERPHPE